MQDIDARKPIGGGFNGGQDRDRTTSDAGITGQAALAGPGLSSGEARVMDTQGLRQPIPVSGYSKTLGEGQRSSDPPGEEASETKEELNPTNAPVLSRFDEQLRALKHAFQTSMDLVERRPSSAGDTSCQGPASSTHDSPRLPFPIPGAAHLRTPSFSASGGLPTDRPSSAPGQARSSSGSEFAPRRRFAGTTGSSPGGENISVWDNRRLRADSAGSLASAFSDRARLFYEQGRASRGSGVSVGNASLESEEAVGRMSFERPEQEDRR